MSKKKVLIITYYWPPSGGSGVQRWLKFVKYLHREGWETLVFTPENPSFTIQDPSLQKDVPAQTEVLRLPIWEPYNLFQRFAGIASRKKNVAATDFITTGRKSLFQKVSSWARGNLFIPDPRVFWVKPSVTFLSDLITANHIDKIITTGPPHSIHLIGLRLKKKFPSLKWVADFRDPWSEWDLLDTLSLTSVARTRHRKLEYHVLKHADRVVTIAPFHVHRFAALGGRKVDLITNGFDTDDFEGILKRRTNHFVIRHIGVVDELRDPRPFMKAVVNCSKSDPSFRESVRIEFIGNVNSAFQEEVKADADLGQFTIFIKNIPHAQLLNVYGETDLQLLVLAHTAIAPGNLPGKFFEYLASGNPILAIGPVEGDAGDVLRSTGAGVIFERGNIEGIGSALMRYFNDWKSGEQKSTGDVSEFTRANLTKKLIGILESL
jgi:glycosyltransferase involved in cell wall biosynthesis